MNVAFCGFCYRLLQCPDCLRSNDTISPSLMRCGNKWNTKAFEHAYDLTCLTLIKGVWHSSRDSIPVSGSKTFARLCARVIHGYSSLRTWERRSFTSEPYAWFPKCSMWVGCAQQEPSRDNAQEFSFRAPLSVVKLATIFLA